jgi:hypothetical protein
VKKTLLTLCWLAACLSGMPEARAHATSTSFLEIQVADGDGELNLRWDLSLHDLVWSVFIDADFDGTATWQEVQEARLTIGNAVLGQLAVARGGAACALRVADLALAERLEQNFLSVALRTQCPGTGPLSVGGSLFMTGDAAQRVLLNVTRDGTTHSAAISASQSVWQEPEQTSAWASFVHFIGEGVWHVLIGYDHIAFILLLLLPSVMRPVEGRWRGAEGLGPVTRDIVTIVTAFTIAHSTTLALAVTGTVVLPIQPVEVAIAASIAVAGGLNLLPRLSRWRLALAFGFGLVHGFGFANVLGELDGPGGSLLPLLAGFNIGVELAQLSIVAVVLPLIYAARGQRWYAGGVLPLGSCALGAAGLVWLVQRL